MDSNNAKIYVPVYKEAPHKVTDKNLPVYLDAIFSEIYVQIGSSMSIFTVPAIFPLSRHVSEKEKNPFFHVKRFAQEIGMI